MPEKDRRAALQAAEARALPLFEAIEKAGLIAPGRRESDVEQDIAHLAERDFGIQKHWHRRIVRAGPNSITIAADYPPDRIIDADDTVYVDLGPVLEGWEADVGKTYALGPNPRKHALVAELPRQFAKVQAHYRSDPGMTGAALYDFAAHSAKEAGWRFGGKIAGHIVSEFAHSQIPGDKELNRIGPRNGVPMNAPDGNGRKRHWILEIHLVEQDGSFGGFYERLL
jgi:Xaa-Pro aminopeptidase